MKHKVGDIVKINGHEFEVLQAIDVYEGGYILRYPYYRNRTWLPASVVDHVTDSVTQDDVKILCQKLDDLARKQEPLGKEFNDILQKHLWDMLEE